MNWNVGALAIWHHLPRGGYGYIHAVPCVVTGVTEKRVQIAVRKTDGFVVKRSVKPEALSPIASDFNREQAMFIRESLGPRLWIVGRNE